jgi:streptogramin lyase
MFRIDPGQNFKEMVVGGLEYSNGVEVDLHGFAYTAEQSGARVRRIDPATGEFSFLAQGLDNPNGLSFSPDYRTLYVGSFGGGTITAIRLNEDMTPASVEPFANIYEHGGGGALDGMAVDACGNVYVCEFGPAIIWRITPDGLAVTQAVVLTADTGWIPNMQWGSGLGGWDTNTMYVLDFSANRVFEVPLGIGDKPRGYP